MIEDVKYKIYNQPLSFEEIKALNNELNLRLVHNGKFLKYGQWEEVLRDFIKLMSNYSKLKHSEKVQDVVNLFNKYVNVNTDIKKGKDENHTIVTYYISFDKLSDSLYSVIQNLGIKTDEKIHDNEIIQNDANLLKLTKAYEKTINKCNKVIDNYNKKISKLTHKKSLYDSRIEELENAKNDIINNDELYRTKRLDSEINNLENEMQNQL